jgi:hypothetical protein
MTDWSDNCTPTVVQVSLIETWNGNIKYIWNVKRKKNFYLLGCSRPDTVDSYNDADVDDYSTQVFYTHLFTFLD